MSNENSTISIKEARNILGEDSTDMTDAEVGVLVESLNGLARSFVGAVQNGDLYAVFMEYNKSNTN